MPVARDFLLYFSGAFVPGHDASKEETGLMKRQSVVAV